MVNMILSIVGLAPTPTSVGESGAGAQSALGAAIGSDLLIVACLALGLLALSACVNVFTARRASRDAARLARSRALGMKELLRTMRMAESIAGIGVWQYDPSTGAQQWSEGLKKLFGIDADEEFVEGDAETLLFANDVDLIGKVRERQEEREPYDLQFDIYGFDGVPRTISVHACNLLDSYGGVQRVVAVVRDATEQVERERALETSREQAIDQAREARILAETDSLTGLANRRRVMSELDRLVIDARVTSMPLVLVMFDIDRFKRVNDTYGHPAGDEVLQKVARLAGSQVREGDLIGRVGGEEFVWIIPGASDGMARIMSERLRQTIAKESGAGSVPNVTISLGYTALQPGDTALSMFARADSALYEAKHSGRNRVRVAA